jgi:hypothetical protein
MIKAEENMGEVIYLPKEYFAACPANKSDNAIHNLVISVGGFLILYGLYRLVRDLQGR